MNPTLWTPADDYDGYYAFVVNGTKQDHIVETQTFDSVPVLNADGSAYDGYTANIGNADALCGREANGRMIPLDTDSHTVESSICQHCLAALERREETGEEELVADGGIDTTTFTLTQGMEGPAIHVDTAQTDIEIGATDAALRGLLDDLLAYLGGGELAVGDKWRDTGGERP